MSRVALIGENSIGYVNALIDIWNNGDCAVLLDWRIPFIIAIQMMRESNVRKCYIERPLLKKIEEKSFSDIKFITFEKGNNSAELLPPRIYDKYNSNYSSDEAIVLYSSGTTGTITLNETSANFSSLEIFFSRNTNMGYDSAKIFGPNGKKANLHLAETGQNGLVLYNAIVAISGTSITFRSGNGISRYALSGSNSGVWCYGVGSTNEIKIYKVIGYR